MIFKNSSEHNKIKYLYFIIVAIIFFSFDFFLAFFVISWKTPISAILFTILTLFLFTFSIKFTEKLFSLFLKPYNLYKLHYGLTTHPKVSVLYSTMNDVLPECLSIIGQTYPCDVFVLDDSTLTEKKEIVDRISKEKGFTVLRREERKGFKAGAINNWISFYGSNYDYFVLLDSDSFIPNDWVEKTLEYAENPLNSKIAIFQGLINIWNLENKFIRTASSTHKIGQDEWELKLANYMDAVFCYGHNVMLRMKSVLKVGGFAEGYTSEDFATAVKLAEHGYKSRFVPLHTYEAMPENISGFIKRQHKWTRGSMEFLSFIKSSYLTLTQKIFLLLIPIGHFSYFGILIAMFLTIFGYATDYSHFIGFLQNLFYYNIFFIWSIPIFRFVIVLQAVSFTINFIKLKQVGISLYDFWKHEILSKAVGAIMLPYEIKSMINYLISRKVQWPVTPKHENKLYFKDIMRISKITLILSLIFLIGLIFVNPLGFIFNVSWLIPFLLAPVTLYLFLNDVPDAVSIDGGTFDVKISSDLSQTRDVYSFLRKKWFYSAVGLPVKYKKIIFVSLVLMLAGLSSLFLYESITAFFIYQPSAQSIPTTNLTVCGNGICEIGENSTVCPADCVEIVKAENKTVLTGGLRLVNPSIIGPNNSKEIYIDDTVKLATHVEKLGDANISKVWCIIKSPSEPLETIMLSNNGIWSNTIKTKELGTWIVVFNAIDESDRYAEQVLIIFTVNSNVTSAPSAIFFGSFATPPSAY